jgi:peptidyl-prolyl cis-trans isomerase C
MATRSSIPHGEPMSTSALKRLASSPVLHFLIAGAALFALVTMFGLARTGNPDREPGDSTRAPETSSTIRVEREDLIAFIQSRTRMTRAAEAARSLDAATPAVKQDWIDRYVREEAIVREARSLGLDRDDELIRRRLVQQMEFLVEGASESALIVTDAELEAAYRERAEELREPATVRFAHVFVREENGRDAEANAKARALLARLNREGIDFDGALALGDRFLYDRHYVDRTLDEVQSHFGATMATTVSELPVAKAKWSGPHRSDHGLHLVLLIGRSEARLPGISEVADALRGELMREKREQAVERGIEAIVAKYRVDHRSP